MIICLIVFYKYIGYPKRDTLFINDQMLYYMYHLDSVNLHFY